MTANIYFKELNETGLVVRTATQQNGWARIYLGDIYESFRSNKCNSTKLFEKAQTARLNTHIDIAMHNLLLRKQEAFAARASTEQEELANLIAQPKLSSRVTASL
ncbi:hypothetical protein ACXZ1M_24385 [Duganella sp. PWIR1]